MQQTAPANASPPYALAHRVDELTALYRLTDSLYRARSLDEIYNAALDAITGTLGCGRASVLLFDEAGVMQFVAWRGLSDHYRNTLKGHSPWKPGEPEPEPIFVSDIDQTAEAEWVKTTIKAENIRALGFIPLIAQGAVIGKFMTYYETARVFPPHEIELAVTIARQLGFSIERERNEQARRIAAEELRESEERFRLMSEHAPVMIWMSDASGHCLHLNKVLRTVWDVEEGAIAQFDWQRTIHPDDAPEIGRIMMEAVAAHRNASVTGRYRNAQGEYRVWQTNAQPRFSPRGEFLGMIGVNVDITERDRAERARDLLLAELNHRVKNTLAVVQGIAHQTFRDTGASGDARKAFEGRLVALAVAHNLLTQANWENAALDQLAADTLQMAAAPRPRIALSGPRVLLPPKEAVAIAMALHELYTNAMKYGALSKEPGRITLTWDVLEQPQPRLKLHWLEQDGPPVAAPARSGFGTLLLQRTLAHDLDGEVTMDFHPAGLVCSIEAPLPPRSGGSRS